MLYRDYPVAFIGGALAAVSGWVALRCPENQIQSLLGMIFVFVAFPLQLYADQPLAGGAKTRNLPSRGQNLSHDHRMFLHRKILITTNPKPYTTNRKPKSNSQ